VVPGLEGPLRAFSVAGGDVLDWVPALFAQATDLVKLTDEQWSRAEDHLHTTFLRVADAAAAVERVIDAYLDEGPGTALAGRP
jgi:hypothetical protein